jgi:hypothetical protein
MGEKVGATAVGCTVVVGVAEPPHPPSRSPAKANAGSKRSMLETELRSPSEQEATKERSGRVDIGSKTSDCL